MTSRLTLAFVAATAVVVAAQQPQIQNGKVETRQASAIDKEIAALGATATDPVWIGWRVPMVDGRRDTCSNYWYGYTDNNSNNSIMIRGNILETNPGETSRPKIADPTGPAPLEAGTNLVILLRVVDTRVERLKTFGDDCPLDANGRTVYWLNGVTPADSLKELDVLTRPDYSTMTVGAAQNLVSDAVNAIGLHRDAGADVILDRMASFDPNMNVRRQAITKLGSTRGAHGFETLRHLLDTEKSQDLRRNIASSIASTRQPQTADVLLALAKSDGDESVRAEAAFNLPARGGDKMIPEILKILGSDGSTNVRQRAISGLGNLPGDTAVPVLIQLAKDSRDVVVRKQAVSVLGRSKDPRAVAFMQELLK